MPFLSLGVGEKNNEKINLFLPESFQGTQMTFPMVKLA